jgi:hypothetical protein
VPGKHPEQMTMTTDVRAWLGALVKTILGSTTKIMIEIVGRSLEL